VLLSFIITGVFTVVASFMSLRLQRKKSSQLHETSVESNGTSSVNVRNHVLELFLGLVVLVCGFAEYYRSALGGNDNFWHVADVACFSMFSHAATLLALRAFFREHKKLAYARVSFMIVVFGLWATIGYYMLHRSGPYYKTPPIVRFWHGATYFEYFGVFWAYILTCVPIFISNEAIGVGRAISSNDTCGLGGRLRIWKEKCILSSPKWCNPVSLLTLLVIRILFSFDKGPKCMAYALSITFRVLFSRNGIGVMLFILWLFTLSALGVAFFTGKKGMAWDFGQLLSLAMVVLPLQSIPSAIASTLQFDMSLASS
jgi:hypothetical protein